MVALGLESAGPGQTPPVPSANLASVQISGSVRSRAEAWDWFEGQQNQDGSYLFSGSLLRLSLAQARENWDWQLEFAAPVLLNLPDTAIAPAPQLQLGLGGNYFAANKRSSNTVGFTKTHSRPHVSDDNPYWESHFRTLKYRPAFPECFGSLQDARCFSQEFFAWYNDEHRHSGLGLLSPTVVHYGLAPQAIERRRAVLDAAYGAHPERFVRKPPQPLPAPKEAWINKPPQTAENKTQ